MPLFTLSYTTAQSNYEKVESLEWVTDGDWDANRTKEAFYRRYPDAVLLYCKETAPDQCSQSGQFDGDTNGHSGVRNGCSCVAH